MVQFNPEFVISSLNVHSFLITRHAPARHNAPQRPPNAATTSEELFRSGDWKVDLAEVLVLAGWRDAMEDFTVYTRPREACCLVAFMEILLVEEEKPNTANRMHRWPRLTDTTTC